MSERSSSGSGGSDIRSSVPGSAAGSAGEAGPSKAEAASSQSAQLSLHSSAGQDEEQEDADENSSENSAKSENISEQENEEESGSEKSATTIEARKVQESEEVDDKRSASSSKSSERSRDHTSEESQSGSEAEEEKKPALRRTKGQDTEKDLEEVAAAAKKAGPKVAPKKQGKKGAKKSGGAAESSYSENESDPLLGGKKSGKKAGTSGNMSSMRAALAGMDFARIQQTVVRGVGCLLCFGSIGGAVAVIWANRGIFVAFWTMIVNFFAMIWQKIYALRPIPCIFDEWSDWSDCSVTCGVGELKSRRHFSPVNCKPHPAPWDLERAAPCEISRCAGRSCIAHTWQDWGPCSQPCGPGVKSRSRDVAVVPLAGGRPCPALVQTVPCEVQQCPKSCRLAPWSPWSPCSRTCGRGQIQRKRTVLSNKASKTCPHIQETSPCHLRPCGAPCTFSIAPRIKHALDLTRCNGTASTEVCHFKCEQGYEPQGPFRCIDGIFVQMPCVPLSCSEEPQIPNSENLETCRGYAVGAVCHVTCSPGFEKSGDIACQHKTDGGVPIGNLFGGQQPAAVGWTSATCTPIRCAAPPKIRNSMGTAPCQGLALGEVCSSFRCVEGFEKSGELRCTHGNFNRPRCVEKPCRQAPPLAANELRDPIESECIRMVTAGLPVPSRSVCPLMCRKRYRKTGDIICLRGVWQIAQCISSDSPCWKEKAGCSDPCNTDSIPEIENSASFKCSNSMHGSECRVDCQKGYVTSGKLLCTNGTWLPPKCERDGCRASPLVLHAGDLSSCADSQDGDECMLVCGAGYHASKASLTCATKQWIGAECLEDTCSLPPRIANGFVQEQQCDGMSPGEFCPLSCDVGYAASPSAGLECLLGGNYAKGICKPRHCSKVPKVSHSGGDLSICAGSANGAFCAVSCAPRYSMATSRVFCDRGEWTGAACYQNIRCRDVPPVAHAVSNLAHCIDTKSGELCPELACLPGYSPRGLLMCRTGGHFARPVCEPTRCTKPPFIDFAHVDSSCSDVESGAVCSVECETGYAKTQNVQCWRGVYSQARCMFMSDDVEKKETISLQLTILHAYQNLELRERGILIGPQVVHSLARVAGISSSRVIDRGMSPRTSDTSVLAFDILPGGLMDQTSAREALDRIENRLENPDGTLEKLIGGSALHMGRVQITGSTIGKICWEEPKVDNAVELHECINTLSGQICPLVCLEGFASTGNLMCSDGFWSDAQCEAIPCDKLPDIEHADDLKHCLGTASGSFCTLECKPGHVASGDLECRHGKFLPAACVAKPCSTGPVVLNGNEDECASCHGMASGQDCILRCLPAMFPSGLGAFRCEQGNWRRLGSCQPADCFHVPSIAHTATDLQGCFGTRHGAYCPFACKEGFTISERLWCLDGQFAASRCEPSRCLSVPQVAGIDEAMLEHCTPASSGSFCVVQCRLGFTLSMPLFCDHGAWSNAACVAAKQDTRSCRLPPDIDKAVDLSHCAGSASGDLCDVSCQEGYELHGMARCADGAWTQHAFCLPRRCMHTPSVPHSTDLRHCAGYSHGSKCMLWCLPGYSAAGVTSIIPDHLTMHNLSRLVDDSSLTCDRGKWIGPVCREAPCDSEPAGIHRAIRVSHCIGTPSREFCHIECKAGFYPTALPQCIKGVWNFTGDVNCHEEPCLDIPVIANSRDLVKCVNTSSRGTCPLECEQGRPVPQELLCFQGAWAEAACLESCDYIPTISDAGDLELCAGTPVGSSCNLPCRSGYRPSSPLRCLEGRRWEMAFCYETAESLSEAVVTNFNLTDFGVTGVQEMQFAATSFRATCARALHLRVDLVSIELKSVSTPGVAHYAMGLWLLCRHCMYLVQRSNKISHSELQKGLRDDLCDELCMEHRKGITSRSCRASCRSKHPLHITGQSKASVLDLRAPLEKVKTQT